jgi:rhodanese-related sulfurtransferase
MKHPLRRFGASPRDLPRVANTFPVLLLAAALLGAAPARAEVALRGAAELTHDLQSAPPCCVIDARSEDSQREHPLPDALRYRTGLQIVPTAAIVVVADRDPEAQRIAAILLKAHPGKTIYAVKGGVAAWETVLKSQSAAQSSQAPGTRPGISFVIPHNTCETGTPLQILQGKPK